MMNDELKDIDFKKLALWYIPAWLRQPTFLLLIYAALMPIIRLFNMLKSYYDSKVYRLTHNGQVCYLEAVLNDKLDATLRRIWIGDFQGKNRIYFWPELERRDVNFEDVQFFWSESDYGDSGVDFTIHLPAGVATSEPQMAYLRSLANEYKLAGKQYNVVWF